MTREELLQFHTRICSRAQELMAKKNNDYAGKEIASLSVFGNLDMAERFGICSTETGILIRMLDKFSRLQTFVKNGDLLVKDESALDSLTDLINYAVLMAAKIEQRKADAAVKETV